MTDEPLATLEASPIRRLFGLTVMFALGGMLVYLGLTLPADLLGRAFLIVLGGFALWGAELMRRATNSTVELRKTGLFDGDGTEIAPLDQILRIDRGVFAFKPSTGFIVTLQSSGRRSWRPGLWWRVGRRVGIGGVTAAHQAKAMAEILSALMSERDNT